MRKIKIGSKYVGDGEPLYFIADIAANHDSDLSRAFKLIELAKDAGADAAKFQNFQAPRIVSRHGFKSMGAQLSHQSSWKKSVFEVYEDASLPFEWTERLKKKCDEVGIEYFTSPYDFDCVDHVDPFVQVYKIGSGDITWHEMIAYIAGKKKPVMLATGASDMKEVMLAMRILQKFTDEIVLMQCNTNYTAKPDNFRYINLNVLKTYRKKFPQAVLGLSDHTHGHATVLGAVALGGRVFEKHFTDDNNREGPDHKFAMNPVRWKEMVLRAREVYEALGDGVKRVEANEADTVMLQRRALRYQRDLFRGHVLEKDDIFPLRPIPRGGSHPYEIRKFIGKRLKRDVTTGGHLKKEDF